MTFLSTHLKKYNRFRFRFVSSLSLCNTHLMYLEIKQLTFCHKNCNVKTIVFMSSSKSSRGREIFTKWFHVKKDIFTTKKSRVFCKIIYYSIHRKNEMRYNRMGYLGRKLSSCKKKPYSNHISFRRKIIKLSRNWTLT